jgi:hypothetical protein
MKNNQPPMILDKPQNSIYVDGQVLPMLGHYFPWDSRAVVTLKASFDILNNHEPKS